MRALIVLCGFLFSCASFAGESWVQNTKISYVEFHGNQFTVSFDDAHTSNGCGHPGSVAAMDTSTEPGKTYYSFFLAAYAAGKTVSVRVTDAACFGDRPTILQIQGH